MSLITAVSMANQEGIAPKKFRKALRKSLADGAPDLSWHGRNERWQADDVSERDRVEAMRRVLREISN
jgi:hypothetical protein